MSAVRIIRDRDEAVLASIAAQRDFTDRLRVGGLDVTPAARQAWWPLAHLRREVAA